MRPRPRAEAADPARRARRLRALRGGGAALVLLTLAGAGYAALEFRVDRLLLARPRPQSRLIIVNLPPVLTGLADRDLARALAPLLDEPWTRADLCPRMADAAARVGWVRNVRHVRRRPDGRFEIACDYRVPVALVAQPDGFVLVDADQVRLPGVYAYQASWMVIDGVRLPPPPAGRPWEGDDLRAGLALIRALRGEPFTGQITAVLVANVGGRDDPRRCHVELATDRAGGRVRWGSAPGRELEENSVDQKLAILRANHARTGRLDAGYPVIDITTFPDRFTIPG